MLTRVGLIGVRYTANSPLRTPPLRTPLIHSSAPALTGPPDPSLLILASPALVPSFLAADLPPRPGAPGERDLVGTIQLLDLVRWQALVDGLSPVRPIGSIY